MMLKQSRQHTNLPANWQGHAPDYALMLEHRPGNGFALASDFSMTQARNCRTIARLLSVWETCRQRKSKLAA